MDAAGLGVVIAGILTILRSWFLIRANRLPFGDGTFWILVGVALCGLGLAGRTIDGWIAALGLGAGDRFWLVLIVLALLGGLLHSAERVARAHARTRELNREIALLRGADGGSRL